MNLLSRTLALLAIKSAASSPARILQRMDVDRWVGDVVPQIRRGHSGYAFGGPSLEIPDLYCELSRESISDGVVVRASIFASGRCPHRFASQEWKAKTLAPDLSRVFGMNHRVRFEV